MPLGAICTVATLVLGVDQAMGQQVQTLVMNPLEVTETTNFTVKHLFVYPIPPTIDIQSITGNLVTVSNGTAPLYSETLFSLHVGSPGAPCPTNDEAVSDPSYAVVPTEYPNDEIATWILKQEAPGPAVLPVNVTFPVPLHFAQRSCIFVELDGTDFAGLAYGVAALLQLQYTTPPSPTSQASGQAQAGSAPAQAPFSLSSIEFEPIVGPGDPGGPYAALYDIQPVHQAGKVAAVYGNASATSAPGAFQYPVASGTWSVEHLDALVHDCRDFFTAANPTYNPAGGTYDLPASLAQKAGFVRLADTTIAGTGLASLATQLKPASGIVFPVPIGPGDCLVHAVIPNPYATDTAGSGAINAEFQAWYEQTPTP